MAHYYSFAGFDEDIINHECPKIRDLLPSDKVAKVRYSCECTLFEIKQKKKIYNLPKPEPIKNFGLVPMERPFGSARIDFKDFDELLSDTFSELSFSQHVSSDSIYHPLKAEQERRLLKK
jgi:hypothetical protein